MSKNYPAKILKLNKTHRQLKSVRPPSLSKETKEFLDVEQSILDMRSV